jgi:hypothetical protein
MLALVNSPSPLSYVTSPMQVTAPNFVTQDPTIGVPSVAPLVQHELLKHVREQAPYTYLRANRELGLTLERTHSFLEQRVQVVSAARALKLARIVAAEPNGRTIFGAAGQTVYDTMHQEMSRSLKGAVRTLPRSWRKSLAFNVTRYMAYKFAGSTNHMMLEPHAHGVYLTLRNGVFADRLETLSGAHAYYRNIFETMLQQFAHIDCEVVEVRRPRVHPNQCNFKIVWDA